MPFPAVTSTRRVEPWSGDTSTPDLGQLDLRDVRSSLDLRGTVSWKPGQPLTLGPIEVPRSPDPVFLHLDTDPDVAEPVTIEWADRARPLRSNELRVLRDRLGQALQQGSRYQDERRVAALFIAEAALGPHVQQTDLRNFGAHQAELTFPFTSVDHTVVVRMREGREVRYFQLAFSPQLVDELSFPATRLADFGGDLSHAIGVRPWPDEPGLETRWLNLRECRQIAEQLRLGHVGHQKHGRSLLKPLEERTLRTLEHG